MSEMPFLSVIMPVYNAENEVSTAIKSIINQKFQAWELLIIDDCSTDKTCDVVQRFTESDRRIILIQKEKNEGPGKAKNLALEKAKGKYVTFCDGDDWIDAEAYYEMAQAGSRNADVVVSGFYKDIYEKSGKVVESSLVSMPAFEISDKNRIIKLIPEMDQSRLFSYAWNKLYCKKIIDEYRIRFSDKKFGEDYDFNIAFFSHVSNLSIVEKGYYHYVKKNEESLTERYIPEFYEINRNRFEKMIGLLKENKCYSGETKQMVLSAYIKHVNAAIARLYDKRANLSEGRRKKVSYILKDELSIEAMKYAKGTGKKEMICNAVFKTNNATINLMFGKILWFMQNKGKKIYERIK